MKKQLKILLTNDDGFSAPGIYHLYNVIKEKYKVIVVAPEEEQSGIGHAFTYHKPLMFHRRVFQDKNIGYSVSGTPADCVKIALGYILSEKPDIIISGINNGDNTGISGYYSGTVSAAREGAFWQVPSIAFSLCEGNPEFFKKYAPISIIIIKKLFFNNTDKIIWNGKNRVFFNVNFPHCHPDECKGIKVTRQSLSYFDDKYIPIKNKKETVEYWLHGERKNLELSEEYDTRAIEKNYISVTPLDIDATSNYKFESLYEIEKML